MKRMKTAYCMTMLMMLGMCAGCENTSKELSEVVEPVRVRTMKVEPSLLAENHGFSGTVEEENGSVLSFSVMGVLKDMRVGMGSRVKKVSCWPKQTGLLWKAAIVRLRLHWNRQRMPIAEWKNYIRKVVWLKSNG